MKRSFQIHDIDFAPVVREVQKANQSIKSGLRKAIVEAYATSPNAAQPSDIEADGFITCYPAHATTQPGSARMTLADARAVRADLIHHTDTDVIEAARVIIGESEDRFERKAARKLLHLMLRTTEHGGEDA